ncbi:2-dehydropantoate 2-reductase N-terminal domain-containing protein [Rhizobium calliandrae]|uniref:2-dehydropantoate 2-reductase n=1 Tax=Rhizobium calliandrae TaxID=1312182 RepID=A0ABT7KM30_9HYPH|nr:2-dehydropantoate 2-reductase N-terminal domain-containing protein [Rhizobium calliandrae]MDL2409675.1 2-dehydropantoate 2-reductase N-terminal domain-containing protein [Rhizobium calliandrae]
MSRDLERNLKIAFAGTGAQGASIGADFALAGLDVTFIEQWPEHVDAMNESGVTVNLPTRSLRANVRAKHLCQVAEIRDCFDIVFLVVKAYDTRWTCQLIEPVLAADGLVVGVQNGMTQHAIASVVGAERTVGAVFDMASNMFVPGIINRQNDHDTSWFALGALDPANRPRVEKIAELLRSSGRVEVTNDIASAKWMKLIVNAAQLVPSAILNLPFAEAVKMPGMEKVMRTAGYEAMRAAQADGAGIVPILGMAPTAINDPERHVDAIFDEVLKTFMMPDTLTTVLQDWRKGRRAEVLDINGHVVETLKKAGHAAPVNERIVEIARSIERGHLTAQASNSTLLAS